MDRADADAVIRDVDDTLSERVEELVDVTRTLVRFRTESVDLLGLGDALPNEEAVLQAWMADRLAAMGCKVDQWEPDPSNMRGNRIIPEWHHWQDRPMTVGRLPGTGDGKSLIINGHVDVVPAGDHSRWTYPPFEAEVHDGRIYGRGTTDMKGGIAAALVALEALRDCGVRLRGDVLFEAVTDEEIGGMGSVAASERGYRADAAVIPEPTCLNIFTATRGILHARLAIQGRAAHAEVEQPPWREGGGVNANHVALHVANQLLRLAEQRRANPSLRHALLGPPSLHITGIHGGSYIATIPEAAELLINATYLPSEADASGFGENVQRELAAAVSSACLHDTWLEEHPPEWTWLLDYPPYEVAAENPLLASMLAAARSAGHPTAHAVGLDSGYDGALLSTLYGITSLAFGPGDIQVAHSTDEFVAIDELVIAARGLARLLINWCELDTRV